MPVCMCCVMCIEEEDTIWELVSSITLGFRALTSPQAGAASVILLAKTFEIYLATYLTSLFLNFSVTICIKPLLFIINSTILHLDCFFYRGRKCELLNILKICAWIVQMLRKYQSPNLWFNTMQQVLRSCMFQTKILSQKRRRSID